jgi:ABC-type nitrate/sulfonate/bicarbonate transport system substrate-binding protein
MVMLDDAVQQIGPYQGVVSVVRKSWLNDNLDTATGYVRAMLSGLAWMYDPANEAECTQLLIDNTKLPAAFAAQMYAVLTDPKLGMARSGTLDLAGVKTVLALRTRYGLPHRTLTNPLAYYDDRAFVRASRS